MAEGFPDFIDRTALIQGDRDFSDLSPRLPGDALQGLAREVVSRLASRARSGREAEKARAAVAAEIDLLADLLLAPSPDPLADEVEALLARKVSMEDLYVIYLSGAARRLGDMWEDDRLSFTQVTLGVGRIYAVLRGLRPIIRDTSRRTDKSALFANVPGEDHTLGVTMAADLFRRDGWDIALRLGLDHGELIHEIERCDVPVIGISVSNPDSLAALARLVLAIRVVKPGAYVLLSGRLVWQAPDLLRPLDADALASDVDSAKRVLRLFSDMLHAP